MRPISTPHNDQHRWDLNLCTFACESLAVLLYYGFQQSILHASLKAFYTVIQHPDSAYVKIYFYQMILLKNY